MKFKIRTDCSLCSSQNLQQVLELPKTPLANELILKKKTQDHYPLSLLLCISCGHLQLKEIIPPNRLFRKYLYVSGTSSVFIKHFENAASHIVKKTNIDKKDLIIEIGSNDGTLLKKFQYLGFNNTLGVDPANKIANIANKNGVETIPEFFNESVSNKILSSKGKARVILANNVFAHSSDLIGITNAIYSLLDEKGYFIFEVSYLLDVIEKLLFDTIYHEHLSYHALKPLVPFFKKNGLSIGIGLLAFLFLFKIGEAFLGRMSLIFYKEIGFTKSDIGIFSKGLGWITTVLFTLIGGFLTVKIGLVRSIFIAGIFMAVTNLLFSLLFWTGKNYLIFSIAVILDDLAAAFATVAFVAFISVLVNRQYTATQYALLASIGTLGRTTLASSSGSLVDYLNGDWGLFFVITSVMVIPSLILIFFLKEKIKALN